MGCERPSRLSVYQLGAKANVLVAWDSRIAGGWASRFAERLFALPGTSFQSAGGWMRGPAR